MGTRETLARETLANAHFLCTNKFKMQNAENESSSTSRECRATGWQRLTGCLKLQVIFRKRATNYRALLRKMTYEDKPSYASWPPCTAPMLAKEESDALF